MDLISFSLGGVVGILVGMYFPGPVAYLWQKLKSKF